MTDTGKATMHPLRKVAIVLLLWGQGRLGTRDLVRIAMRFTRFDAWGVRLISQARFRALHTALHAAQSRPPDADPDPASGRIAARNVILTASLEQAEQTIAHLRRVERLYRERLVQAEPMPGKTP